MWLTRCQAVSRRMQHETLIHERVALARAARNPTLIGRLASGWAVLGDCQLPRGYCLLLPDPVVPSLNDLEHAERASFLSDMAAIGDALLAVTGAFRINYEILGNSDPALHAHVFARHASEPPERLRGPVWLTYPADERQAMPFDPNTHGELRATLRDFLQHAGRLR
jgi:diadenosine tetraphosphate (Ap4A) HIT family hydrolase